MNSLELASLFDPIELIDISWAGRESIGHQGIRNYSIYLFIERAGTRDQLVELFRKCTFEEKVLALIEAENDKQRTINFHTRSLHSKKTPNIERELEIQRIAEEIGFYSSLADVFPVVSTTEKKEGVTIMQSINAGGIEVGKLCSRRTKLLHHDDGSVIYPKYSIVRIYNQRGEMQDLLHINSKDISISTTDWGDAANRENSAIQLSNAFGSFADILTYFHEHYHHIIRADTPEYEQMAREHISENMERLRYFPEESLQPLTTEQIIALLQDEFRPWQRALEEQFALYDFLEINDQIKLREDTIKFAASCFSSYVGTAYAFSTLSKDKLKDILLNI